MIWLNCTGGYRPAETIQRVLFRLRKCLGALVAFTLNANCASTRSPQISASKIEFHLRMEFADCKTSGLGVQCESETDICEEVLVTWFDDTRGWGSRSFSDGILPSELVCSEHVGWLFFKCLGTEFIWLSGKDDLRQWEGCSVHGNSELFYAPLGVAPAGQWSRYMPASGAEFVAIRLVNSTPPFSPVAGVPVSGLTFDGKEEVFGATDSSGLILLSKDVLKEKKVVFVLLAPIRDYHRAAIPVSDVLAETGSFVREVRLAFVAFY